MLRTQVYVASTDSLTSQDLMYDLRSITRKGVYILIIFVSKTLTTVVGQLGKHKFYPGHYSYTGSAVGEHATGLPSRVLRHMKTKKTRHWHIDYLLSEEAAKILSIIVIPSDKNRECEIHQRIRARLKGEIIVPRFGATDCTMKCGSHLLYLPHVATTHLLIREIRDFLHSACDSLID